MNIIYICTINLKNGNKWKKKLANETLYKMYIADSENNDYIKNILQISMKYKEQKM